MNEQKSVFERLENIEQKLSEQKNNNEPVSVSKLIGEDFGEYLSKSTVYYYESDERKFNKFKQSKLKKHWILESIFFIPLIIDIILSIVYNYFFIISFITSLFLLIYATIPLVFYYNIKPKTLANSKWNVHNTEFYSHKGLLKKEENKSTFAKTYVIITILVLVVILLLGIISIINGNPFGFWLNIVKFYLFLSTLRYFSLRDYHYNAYIFDTEKSYVVFDGDWKKFNK